MFALNWTVLFLIIALIAAFFGWGGIATTAAGMAKIFFFVFLAVFLLSLVVGMFRNQPPAVR
jgi:uncharacterized membrane protein YtjA (UPF0391 family)